jgi:type IV secretion system protein VirD4
MDFDDQILLAFDALDRDRNLWRSYRSRFRYWCVDEAQDTSRIQHNLVWRLTGRDGNVFMVGDEDQSVFGYRGAYPKAMLNFRYVYRNAFMLKIERNYRSGEEHGSARWATPRELRRLSDEASPDDNILLTQNVRLAMSRDDHDPRWERNRNVVVIGGSGSGKTRTYVEPNLMQMNASYLVTDPKGTTVRRLGSMLAAHGYDVRTLNTVDFSLSMRYNPLAYVRTQQDVLELVECLIVNTTPKGKSANDPFWENSERLLYCALIGYLTYHCPPEDRTLPGLMTLLSLAEARDEDESFMSPLDVLFRELETGCRCVAAPGAAGGDGRSMGGARESVRWVPWCDPATPDSD